MYSYARTIRRSAAPLFLALLALALSFALLPAPARSEATTDPSRLVSDLSTRALAIVHETQPESAARFERFHPLVVDSFDVPGLARFVTGKYWDAATDEDRRRFTAAFATYVTELVTTRFARYTTEKFAVLGQRDVAEGIAVVSSQVVHPNAAEPDRVDWRVAKTDGGFRIRDVSVGGVSIVETKRSEFASVLASRGSIAALAAILENRSAQLMKTAKRD